METPKFIYTGEKANGHILASFVEFTISLYNIYNFLTLNKIALHSILVCEIFHDINKKSFHNKKSLLKIGDLTFVCMAEEEGFEPPRAVTPLSVFKTDPFSRTWVFLRIK